MTAVHPRFLLYAGDTWEFDAALHDNAGAALNLTGAAIVWRLRDAAQVVRASLSIGDGLGITVTDAAGGLCKVVLFPAQTALLAPAIYRDEIQVTLADGFVTTQAVGEISVQRAGGLPTPGPDLWPSLRR